MNIVLEVCGEWVILVKNMIDNHNKYTHLEDLFDLIEANSFKNYCMSMSNIFNSKSNFTQKLKEDMFIMLIYYSTNVFSNIKVSLICRIYYSFSSQTCSSGSSESLRKPHRLKAQLLMTLPMLFPRIISKFYSFTLSSTSASNLALILPLQTA